MDTAINERAPHCPSINLAFTWILVTASILFHGCATQTTNPIASSSSTPSQAVPNDNKATLLSSNAEAFQKAVADNDFTTVQQLLSQGVLVDIKDSRGVSPLIAAAAYGRLEMAKFLLAHGANINLRMPSGATVLHVAAESGQTAMVQWLLVRGMDPNITREDGWTALHRAAERGYFQMAQDLLRSDAQIDPQNRDGATPLYLASQNGHTEIVEMLIAKGADVNVKIRGGATPLHGASALGHESIVRLLITHDANVNAEQNDESTPMLLAIQANRVEIARILLEHGANAQSSFKNGWGLLHAATRISSVDLADLLLSYGAKIDAAADKVGTPLHIAAAYGNNIMMNLLLSHGANPTILIFPYGTAADVALATGHLQSAEILRYASGMKGDGSLGFLPDNIASRYLKTKYTGFLFDTRKDVIHNDAVLTVTPTSELKENMYLVAKIIAPHTKNSLGILERSAANTKSAGEVEFQFKDVDNLACGLYRLEVEIYEDKPKRHLVGLHQQGIMSTINSLNISDSSEIISKGPMGTCQSL